ncbi:MAG: HepT-like ribonuclease domain-containing protein [Geminicoccaceae bacterium]
MAEAIADIRSLTSAKNEDDYLGDRLLRRAVERCLEIVSEASRSLSADDKADYPAIPWRGIADFGNVLRHAYGSVSDRRVWSVVVDDLPNLEAAVMELIQRHQRDLAP